MEDDRDLLPHHPGFQRPRGSTPRSTSKQPSRHHYHHSDRQSAQLANAETKHIDPYLRGILHRLKNRKVRVETLVKRCEAVDRNHDDIIHISDLEEILLEYLGTDGISRRELDHLSRLLSPTNTKEHGIINYKKLLDVLDVYEEEVDQRREYLSREEEKWYDPAEMLADRAHFKRGSVGDWLQNAACPAEVKNFRRFIRCLEEYERLSGMKCVMTEEGFNVAMGPDLKANISFYMTG